MVRARQSLFKARTFSSLALCRGRRYCCRREWKIILALTFLLLLYLAIAIRRSRLPWEAGPIFQDDDLEQVFIEKVSPVKEVSADSFQDEKLEQVFIEEGSPVEEVSADGFLDKELEQVFFKEISVNDFQDEELEQVLLEETPKGDIDYQINSLSRENAPEGIPVIVFTFNRADSLSRTLKSLFKALPEVGSGMPNFPIIISQDGYLDSITEVAKKYWPNVILLRFDWEASGKKMKEKFTDSKWIPYHRISAHFGFVFEKIFDEIGYSKAIIIEDDFDVAVDFFAYFTALETVLDTDPTVYCISAWNDNGLAKFVQDPKALYRTDVFPGLGWMLSKDLWNEVEWPRAFWDEFLREEDVRKGRQCIYPEVNRVYTFGSQGTSKGQLFKKYLKDIKLNTTPTNWTDLDFLRADRYDKWLEGTIATAVVKKGTRAIMEGLENIVVYYDTLKEYTRFAKRLGLITDHKNGLPRTSYRGVVNFRYKGNHVFLVPSNFKTLSQSRRGRL